MRIVKVIKNIMKINVETPYNVGDVIYIFSTENVTKYRDLLISEQVTFEDICKYLCVKCTVSRISCDAYIKKCASETKISLRLYRPLKNLHNLRELFIAENSEINEYEILKRCQGVDDYDIIEVEDGLLSPLDKSILNSNSIIEYLKNKDRPACLRFEGIDIKCFEKINKHLEKYNFKDPDTLYILVSELINKIAIYDADSMYKRDAVSEWREYRRLTGINLRNYNVWIIKCTQNMNSSIIPLISLGIIGEITVDEFKSILKIN